MPWATGSEAHEWRRARERTARTRALATDRAQSPHSVSEGDRLPAAPRGSAALAYRPSGARAASVKRVLAFHSIQPVTPKSSAAWICARTSRGP